MSKRRLSAFAVHTDDWMRFRAYLRFNPGYDGYYLKLANAVFGELNRPERFFRGMLRREQLVELAVVLVSWFEDYANEIGLWSAFTRKNKELYGYRLPFFNADNGDDGEMNTAGIAYLLWHYCCKATQTFIDPDSQGLAAVADTLLDLFDEALDKAPSADMYDDFLAIDAGTSFFELKSKLHWIAFRSYLHGPEFLRMLQESLLKLAQENSEVLAEIDDPGKIIYAMQDDYLYNKSSSFLAFTMPEWLAEVARCPEELRDDIRRLSRRVSGDFIYESAGGHVYRFRHTYTKRHFEVQRESVELKGILPGYLVAATLVNWRGTWHVTGTLASPGEAATVLEHRNKTFDPSSVSFYAWDEDKQQLLREVCGEMEAAHLEYFNGPLAFFHREKDLEAAMENWRKFFTGKKTGRKPARSLLSRFRLTAAVMRPPGQTAGTNAFIHSPSDLHNGKGIAIYYEPGEGVLLSPLVARLAWAMEQPALDNDAAKPLFFDIFSECSPTLARYLVEQFSARNLCFPVDTRVPLLPHFEFLLRFYNPGDFREVTPHNTLMPEED